MIEPTASSSPAIGTRRGNLVADIPRMVQVMAAIEHRLHEPAKLLDQLLAARLGRGRLPQEFGGQADVFRRVPPRQHVARPRLDRAEMIGQQFDQPMAGGAQQFRVVGRLDPLAGRVDLGNRGCHSAKNRLSSCSIVR